MRKRNTKAAAVAIARTSMVFRIADYLAEVDIRTLGTLTVYVLTKLQALDVATYNYLGSQLARNTLNECRFSEALDQLKQRVANGDTGGAAEVAEWLGGLVVGLNCLASGLMLEPPVETQEPAGRKTGKEFVM